MYYLYMVIDSVRYLAETAFSQKHYKEKNVQPNAIRPPYVLDLELCRISVTYYEVFYF